MIFQWIPLEIITTVFKFLLNVYKILSKYELRQDIDSICQKYHTPTCLKIEK